MNPVSQLTLAAALVAAYRSSRQAVNVLLAHTLRFRRNAIPNIVLWTHQRAVQPLPLKANLAESK